MQRPTHWKRPPNAGIDWGAGRDGGTWGQNSWSGITVQEKWVWANLRNSEGWEDCHGTDHGVRKDLETAVTEP